VPQKTGPFTPAAETRTSPGVLANVLTLALQPVRAAAGAGCATTSAGVDEQRRVRTRRGSSIGCSSMSSGFGRTSRRTAASVDDERQAPIESRRGNCSTRERLGRNAPTLWLVGSPRRCARVIALLGLAAALGPSIARSVALDRLLRLVVVDDQPILRRASLGKKTA
jgi:hypothetical protein